ncbi:MAG: hypothetical protein M3256_24650 [Actinomycetota bacterium]|nr:hypothetical protein [Actinomycetota bacterium]
MVLHSRGELVKHLNEQRQFLRSSALSFDQGQVAEAKRMALGLRILVHQTARSNSLLNQLGVLTTMKFFDSTNGSGSLTVLVSDAARDPRHVGFLDEAPPRCGRGQWLRFSDWWEMPVLSISQESHFSRRELVLAMAHTDGGAHVGEMDDGYARISRSPHFGPLFAIDGELRPVGNPVHGSIRQIAFEADRSLERALPANERVRFYG